MANIAKYNSRVISKHDTETNWNKATNFIPLKGEIIVYDRDDTYNYERFKIGDGETVVGNLPFADTRVTQAAAITTDGEYPLLLGYNTNTTSLTNTVNKTTTLKYNPSTQILTAPTFKGDVIGNADTATIAGLAGMANQDGEGRNIITTYATKGSLNSLYYTSPSAYSRITDSSHAAFLRLSGQGLQGDFYIPYAEEDWPGLLKIAPSEDSLEEETNTKRFVKISENYYAYVQLPNYHTNWRYAKNSEWGGVNSTGIVSSKELWLATTDASNSNQLIGEAGLVLQNGLSANMLPGGQMYLNGAQGNRDDGKISAYNTTNEWNTWRNCYLKGGESTTASTFLTIGGGDGLSNGGQSQYLLEASVYYTISSAWQAKFRVNTAGTIYAKDTQVRGMDYAELFEWADQNTENEDRRGLFVTLSIGDKTIQIADNVSNDEILGIVSATPSVIGNAASFHWNKKYLTDVFGEELVQEVEIPEEVLEDGTVIEAHTVLEPILNPDYNPELEYIPRTMRSEWATIGLLGQLVVCDDGTCVAGMKCKCGANGMATISTDKTGWRVLERLDENHVRILFK